MQQYGTPAFANVGLTPPVLRDPNSSLANLPSPTAQQLAALGTDLQRCAVGSVFVHGLDASLHFTDARVRACIADRINTDVTARPFLTFELLDRRPDLPAARALVRTLTACVDIETLILRSASVTMTAAERQCVGDFVGAHEAELETLLAQGIAGEAADAQTFAQFLRPAVVECARGGSQ